MQRNRVTILELSRILGLSTCTVSRVLNRSFVGFTYAEETIKRVEKCAAKMGYVPNAQAKGLRMNKSMLVGLVLPSAEVGVFGALTHRLEVDLRKQGYQLLITHTRNEASVEKELIRTMLARGIDGLLWIPSRMVVRPAAMGLRLPFPVVIVDRPHCSTKIPFVATDNRAASRLLAERISACGHRQLAAVNAPHGDRSMQERLQGLADVYGGNLHVTDIPNDAAEAKRAVLALLEQPGPPSVIVALSESLAMGALSALREKNLDLPADISFASFDAFPLSDYWHPPITLIRQDLDRVASESVRLLLKYIANPGLPVENLRIPAALEWRESVAATVHKEMTCLDKTSRT